MGVRPAGAMLRYWREERRLSQLELSTRAVKRDFAPLHRCRDCAPSVRLRTRSPTTTLTNPMAESTTHQSSLRFVPRGDRGLVGSLGETPTTYHAAI